MSPNVSIYSPPGDTREHYAAAPPIQLQCPCGLKWASGTYLSLKLLAVPGNNDFPMYLMIIQYFDNRTPEEWLMFRKALSNILIHQNITTGPPTYGMAQRLME
jgi:hypothetical protein